LSINESFHSSSLPISLILVIIFILVVTNTGASLESLDFVLPVISPLNDNGLPSGHQPWLTVLVLVPEEKISSAIIEVIKL
jgi:hypothetical protein